MIKEALINELYSLNLSNTEQRTWKDSLDAKVAAQISALALGQNASQYSANIGANISKNAGEADQTSTSIPPTTNAAKIWNYLIINHNFTPHGAAGVIGNLMQESSPNIDPTFKQYGGGPGRGIMQWTVSERWASLLSWATGAGRDPNDLYTQLDWMIMEMKSYKHKGNSVFSYFLTINDVKEAVYLFETTMEKAGKPLMEKRYRYAQSVFDNFSEGGKDKSGSPSFKGRTLKYWEDKYG